MPHVRVRAKHQITIPSGIAQAAHIKLDDVLDIAYANGIITLVSQKRRQRKESVMSYAGIARGLWGNTAAEIDASIRNDRDSWER